KTIQKDFKYFDNIQLIEERVVLEDSRDILEKFTEATLLITKDISAYKSEMEKELEENYSKISTCNKLISLEKRIYDEIGNLVKVIFEDYEDYTRNYETDISYQDTSLNPDNEGVYTKEITKSGDFLISEKITHNYHR